MDRYLKAGACIIFCALIFTGCGQGKLPDIIDTDTLSVNDRGEITFYLVKDFEKEYYDLSELSSMVMGEIVRYNTENSSGTETPISVQEVKPLEDGSSRVRIIYQYEDADTFNGYNEFNGYNDENIFYGTLQDAVSAGCYGQEESLVSVKDGESYDVLEDQDQMKKHVIITDQKAVIYCPYKVSYLSQGAVLREDGSVDVTQTQGNVIILMKK